MVDFNSEGTVTTPPSDVLKILILEKRESALEAINLFQVKVFNGRNPRQNYIRASLYALWCELQAMLYNSVATKEKVLIKGAKEVLTNKKLKEVLDCIEQDSKDWKKALEFINAYLYGKGLIKVDSRQHYDKSRVSAINRQKGL